MSLTIWKFPLAIKLYQRVPMPDGAKLLDIQMQHGAPQLWALVDDDTPEVSRELLTYGTGHSVVNPGAYVGTYQTGPYVFHVFEIAPNALPKQN